MSLHLKLLDIDHPLTFEESKFRQIEAHALIYLRMFDIHVHKVIIASKKELHEDYLLIPLWSVFSVHSVPVALKEI